MNVAATETASGQRSQVSGRAQRPWPNAAISRVSR
jgi:hypothetical protein